jgi:hypothetical protein
MFLVLNENPVGGLTLHWPGFQKIDGYVSGYGISISFKLFATILIQTM